MLSGMTISGARAGDNSHWVADPQGLRVERDFHNDLDGHRHKRLIVVGVDGSDESIEALRRASRLARLLAFRLSIVGVWDERGQGRLTALGWDGKQEAENMLAYATREVFGSALPPRFETRLIAGNPADRLIELSQDAEMLVLGKRGHSALTDLVMGSVSEKCANAAHCPVLVVPFGTHTDLTTQHVSAVSSA